MNTANKTRKQILQEIPRLRRYARSLCLNAEDADDLVQSCLERALSRLAYFQVGTNLRAWLMTIMHNLHVNSLKAASRTPANTVADPDQAAGGSSPPAWPQTLAVRDLGAALARLSHEHREALLLVGLEQYSYKDAARIAGISTGTLMSRLHRARKQLAALLSDGGRADIRRVK